MPHGLGNISVMRPIQSPLEQLKSVWPVILLVLAISAAFIGKVLILNHWTGFGLGRLTRDLASIGGLPPFAGFLSQAGLLLWAASAAICLVGARALTGRGNSRATRSFLTSAGLLTVLLCIDDAFQLHENVLPFFGIPEVFVLGGYVFLMVGFLVKYQQRIRQISAAHSANRISLIRHCAGSLLDIDDPRSLASAGMEQVLA